jgi:hypothetical protein
MFYDCKSFNALGFSIVEIKMIFLQKKKKKKKKKKDRQNCSGGYTH